MGGCRDCQKALNADAWANYRVVKTEPGRYFQGPQRTWLLEGPGLKAFMVDDTLLCTSCYEQRVIGDD